MEAAAQNQTSHSSRIKAFFDAFPVIQWVVAGVIGLAATWTTIQLTQNSQAAEIRRNSEKIERLEKEFVGREIFDERTLKIIDEQKEQRKLIEKLIERK